MGRVATGSKVSRVKVTLDGLEHSERGCILTAGREPRCCHAVATRDGINERSVGSNRHDDMRRYAVVDAGMRTALAFLEPGRGFDSLNRHDCRRPISGSCLPISSSGASRCHGVATATGTVSADSDGSVRIARDPATKAPSRSCQIGVSKSRALVNASPAATNFEGTDLGSFHSCTIVGKLGEISCTGMNAYGQLGLDNDGSLHTPTRIDGPSDRIVSSGALSTCARSEDGSLWCPRLLRREPLSAATVWPRDDLSIPRHAVLPTFTGDSICIDKCCTYTSALTVQLMCIHSHYGNRRACTHAPRLRGNGF